MCFTNLKIDLIKEPAHTGGLTIMETLIWVVPSTV